MISLSKKFLYIHIPKTAGTSLKHALSKYESKKHQGVDWSKYFEFLKEKNWNTLFEKTNIGFDPSNFFHLSLQQYTQMFEELCILNKRMDMSEKDLKTVQND